MTQREIINKTAKFVQEKLSGEGTGHDWWHTFRVWQMAQRIGQTEKANLFVVELAALLHDIADWKFQDQGDDAVGAMIAKEWLEKLGVDTEKIARICKIMVEVSFKGAGVQDKVSSQEGVVVQDADRLDALGAMGIARCFAYGGYRGRPLYDPTIKPQVHQSFAQYKNSESTSINHFYEKLLLLKSRMHTKTGKQIAAGRHRFIQEFLARFFQEWEGKI